MLYKASENYDDSGIGLFIVRKAIEKLDGEIVASSTIGEGSSFSIFLPSN